MSKNPVLIPQAFAANGSKNNIQNTRQPGQDPEDATWSDGFPNVTMQPVESGGLPPKGMDFNGILNALSATIVHMQKGNLFYFDKAYCDAFGGYQKGAVLLADDGTKVFISVADKNTNNPNQNPQYWEVIAGIGLNAASASKLFEGRNIGGVFFDGTQDIDLPGVNTRGNQDTTGNAATATRLQTARTINGVPFDGTQDINATPAGTIMYFARDWAPTGWLKANGAAVSRTAYAGLFAVLGTYYGQGDGSTTFNLPDLRGEFIRSYDDRRGVDPGRWNGSWQGDAIRNITGACSGAMGVVFDGFAGAFFDDGTRDATVATSTTKVTYNDDFCFDASRVVPTANENRPRNIALLACIKV
nr:phage tail protein [Snodgrassella alvi]